MLPAGQRQRTYRDFQHAFVGKRSLHQRLTVTFQYLTIVLMRRQYDIAIVGAGLVGSSMACALSSTSYRIALIDCQAPLAFEHGCQDGRSIALALASKKIYATLGLWKRLDKYAAPIKKIHISNQGRFGTMRLNCVRYGVESFGYLVPAERLSVALQQAVLRYDNIRRLQPYRIEGVESHDDAVVLHGERGMIRARLLIAADGSQSLIRRILGISVKEKQYMQTAITGSLGVENHSYTAYERFTEHGPLALLPRVGNRCGFIWMNPDTVAKEYTRLSDKGFLERLQRSFGYRLGYFYDISQRFVYPLSLSVSQQRVRQRVILIGNAAQTLHPIAGQGLNLALRDVTELGEVLTKCENVTDAMNQKLSAYESKRKSDIENTVRFTDRLNSLIIADYPGLSHARGLGLALLGAIPPLEERIVRQSMGALNSPASLLRGRILQSGHA